MNEFDNLFSYEEPANESAIISFGEEGNITFDNKFDSDDKVSLDDGATGFFSEACKFVMSSMNKHIREVETASDCPENTFNKLIAINGEDLKHGKCRLLSCHKENHDDTTAYAVREMTDRVNKDLSESKYRGLITIDDSSDDDDNFFIDICYNGKGNTLAAKDEDADKDSNEACAKESAYEGEFNMFDELFGEDLVTESVATNLRRDLQADPNEAMSLKSMYNVYMNADALAKYEDKFAQLKHVNKNAENLRGHMYFMNGELVAFISIEYKSGKTWIDTLEVVKKFRGNKLSFQLLDVAVRKFHATDLRVNKENEKAIGIFKTYGFKTYDHKGNWLYMTLREDAKEIENEETEKARPITDNLKSDMIKEAKQRAANESAMDEGFDEFLSICLEAINGVKSVDDLLAEARVTLNKKLKTVEDCDAYLEVIKNESAKFNEACGCLVSAYAKYNHSKQEFPDRAELKKTTSAAIMLLRQNCRRLNVSLGDIAHSEGKNISRNDIKRFGQYVAGLRKITNEIKDARKKGVALEFALPTEDVDEAEIALESAAAADEFFAMLNSDEDIAAGSIDTNTEIAEESAETDDDTWRYL